MPTVPAGLAGRAVVTDEYIPHAHLFPRCALIVHHGGAGTTHSSLLFGLRAGPDGAAPEAAAVLALPCSPTADQPFWADILYRAGVGPEPILAKSATRATLAGRFRDALTGPKAAAMRARAGALAVRVRADDGIAGSVHVLEAHARQNGVTL